MLPWSEVIDPVADQNGFADVVSVHRGGESEFARAYGLGDREHLLAHRPTCPSRAGRGPTCHLPVKGSGDGGIYSTAADITTLWQSLFAGRIVPARWVADMVRPRSDVPTEQVADSVGRVRACSLWTIGFHHRGRR